MALVDDLKLVMVCSRDMEKAARVSEKYGAQATTQWDEVFDSKTVDGVIVTGPPELHLLAIVRAKAATIPIYCEKPLAYTGAELSVETLHSDRLCVGYNFAYSAPLASLLTSLRASGDIRHARVLFLTNKPRDPLWRCSNVLQSLLLAIGVHPIAMLVTWFGEPSSVQASLTPMHGSLLNLDVALTFSDCRTAVLRLGNFAPTFGTEYEFVLSDGTTALLRNHRDLVVTLGTALAVPAGLPTSHSPGVRYPTDDEAGYVGALRNFAEVIRGVASPAITYSTSLAVHAIIDSILAQCDVRS